MTTEGSGPGGSLPFLVRRAEPMVQPPAQHLRYDLKRQVVQMHVNGCWIDAPDASGITHCGTRITRVEAETTDDE